MGYGALHRMLMRRQPFKPYRITIKQGITFLFFCTDVCGKLYPHLFLECHEFCPVRIRMVEFLLAGNTNLSIHAADESTHISRKDDQWLRARWNDATAVGEERITEVQAGHAGGGTREGGRLD